MEASSSLVIEHQFDDQTLEELNTLREIRLGLARKQLAEAEITVNQLFERGLLKRGSKKKYVVELQDELTKKIARLENMKIEGNNINFDEIEFYIDLLAD